ncbi:MULTISPECIES: glycosyltransferase [unclassified Avibacterium]|uniref:glycosyltransferase n=1 Tax=unclassified Avibacterium TaxID=2685287 RepID=UPI0020265801|nr:MULTISPECIES: glycosyltransferase [unclassified Avibacterium]MCW9699638.1 glycosyltransferase [Avibacterium sp. 20-129]URL06010.1 glycosyltransferase [Avibacterium sp. 21-595]
MKILFLHKWLIVGGIERVLVNYFKLLYDIDNLDIDNLDIDLLIAFEKEKSPFIEEIPNNINISYIFNKDKTLQIEHSEKYRKNNLLHRVFYKLRKLQDKSFCKRTLSNVILNGNYDVIINFSNHFDPYLEFKNISVPIIRWQHLALDIGNVNLKKEKNILKNYTKVVSICNEMTEQIKRYTGLEDEKLFTLFNPIDFSTIIEKSLRSIPDIKKPYFIQVARLDKIKRHKDLINIYAKLVDLGIEENLYIIGDGEEYSNLMNQIKKLNLEDRCFLLGEIKNPYPYMKNAKLFLHVSEREGLPTVLLESLILNVPVIAMNCETGVKEILNYGKCGKLIEFFNQESFIEECFKLSQCNSSLEKYKIEIRKHLSLFSEENIKYRFLTLLKNLLRK